MGGSLLVIKLVLTYGLCRIESFRFTDFQSFQLNADWLTNESKHSAHVHEIVCFQQKPMTRSLQRYHTLEVLGRGLLTSVNHHNNKNNFNYRY